MDQSQLVATFELRPLDLMPTLTGTAHNSTRPTNLYGEDQPWPLPVPDLDGRSLSPVEGSFAHAAAGHLLYFHERVWHERSDHAFSYYGALAHTSWVILADGYSAYRRSEFVSAMYALKQFKVSAAPSMIMSGADSNGENAPTGPRGEEGKKPCSRLFTQDGLFENLLSIDRGAYTEWRYGPFITTRLSPRTTGSFVHLPPQSQFKDQPPSAVSGA